MGLARGKKQGQEDAKFNRGDKLLMFVMLAVLSCMSLFLNLDYDVRQESLRRARDLTPLPSERLKVPSQRLEVPSERLKAPSERLEVPFGRHEYGDSVSWNNWPVNKRAIKELKQLTEMIGPGKLHQREIRGTVRTEPFACGTNRVTEKCLLQGSDQIQQYKSCAILGSGGILTGSLCGDEIDSHDFVLRFNLAPIDGYQKDVGSKTTLTSLNNAIMFNVNIRPKLNPFAATLRLSNRTMFLAPKGKFTRVFRRFYKAVRTNRVIINLKYFAESIHETGLLSMLEKVSAHVNVTLTGQPTTGLIAILMSTHFCQRINLYGFWPFDRDSNNRTIPYHYYTIPYFEPRLPREEPHKKGEQHDFDREFAFYQALQSKGVLHIMDTACKTE
ncbi:CMP-N-acetylneuraminate-poly-alpha-2,8-sialyltransferase-like [Branchiostoma lanceolatum]|uniref:CMP-N-acetylneuraminate-poly-alpha-2, 8-sialyltransferase-like n=1 Tax=Branchiostoma lanceolatum TaxID=7740 RepID=UPI0034518B6B